MAIRKLSLNLDTPEEYIFPTCNRCGLKGDECNEVYHSLDALRVWRTRLEGRHGPLLDCAHHSNPDDPPDMTFRFRDAVISVEHTRLEPHPYGHMAAIKRKEFPGSVIRVPSISNPPNGRTALIEEMFSWEKAWSPVEADLNEWYRICLGLIRRKIEHQKGGILVIQDTSLIFGGNLEAVGRAVHQAIAPHPTLIGAWTIILHSRSNFRQFHSYLITGGEDLQHQYWS